MIKSNHVDNTKAQAGGMVVVDPDGLRLGEVHSVVAARNTTHLVVVSGGIFGLARTRVLIPVEAVTKVDDRVHVDRTYAEVHRRRGRLEPTTRPGE